MTREIRHCGFQRGIGHLIIDGREFIMAVGAGIESGDSTMIRKGIGGRYTEEQP